MPSDPTHQAAVLGAGSGGTALAIHLGNEGHDVALWGRDPALLDEMVTRRVNPTYLPDIRFPESLRLAVSLSDALSGACYVIVAVPSHGLRAVVRAAAPHIPRDAVLVSATKGLETDTLQRMSEVIAEETQGKHPVVALSGPSFAMEVARQLPTALVAASTDRSAVPAVQHQFRGRSLRVSSDRARRKVRPAAPCPVAPPALGQRRCVAAALPTAHAACGFDSRRAGARVPAIR